MRGIHLFTAVIFAGILLAAPMSSSAELARGSIMIHARLCPAGAIQLFRDCHDVPGPAGIMYTVDSRVPKATNLSGNVSFGQVTAGDHLIRVTSGFDPAAYSRLAGYCSNSTTGIYPHVAIITFQPNPQFWVRVGSGSRLTCDLYYIP
jgi:hypothetical protein